MRLKLGVLLLICIPGFMLATTYSSGTQTFSKANPESATNLRGGYRFIGNTVQCVTNKTNGFGGTCQNSHSYNNNSYYTQYVTHSGISGSDIYNSSGATLDLPTDAQVKWAGLYWNGILHDDSYFPTRQYQYRCSEYDCGSWYNGCDDAFDHYSNSYRGSSFNTTEFDDNYSPGVTEHHSCTYQGEALNNVKIDYSDIDPTNPSSSYGLEKIWFKAGTASKQEITADHVDYYRASNQFYMYNAFTDVTDIIKSQSANSSREYIVANVASTSGKDTGLGNYGAWVMVVVFEDGKTLKNISVYDGLEIVSSSSSNKNINISGFLTPTSGTINSNLSFFATEGEGAYSGDNIQLDNKDIPGATANNVVNATITSDPSFSHDPDYSNNNGIDIHTYDVSTLIGNGQTSAKIKLSSSSDLYFPSVVVFDTELYEPDVCFSETYVLTDDRNSDGKIDVGDTVQFTVEVTNKDNENAKGVTVQKYYDEYMGYESGSMKMQPFNNSMAAFSNDSKAYYNNTDDSSTYYLGQGASYGNGGTIGFDQVHAFRYDVSIDQFPESGELQNTYLVSYSNDELGINFTGLPMQPCDTNQTINIDPPEDICYLEEVYHYTSNPSSAELVDNSNPIEVGEKILYKITIQNTGYKTINDLVLKKQFDQYLRYTENNDLWIDLSKQTDSNNHDYAIYMDAADPSYYADNSLNLVDDQTALFHIGNSPESAYYPDHYGQGGTLERDDTATIWFAGLLDDLPSGGSDGIGLYDNSFDVAYLFEGDSTYKVGTIPKCADFNNTIQIQSVDDVCYRETIYRYQGGNPSGTIPGQLIASGDSISTGDMLLYEITIKNERTKPIHDVVLKKTFDEYLTYQSNTIYMESGSGSYAHYTDDNDSNDYGIYFGNIDVDYYRNQFTEEYQKFMYDQGTLLYHLGDDYPPDETRASAYYPSNTGKGGTLTREQNNTILFAGVLTKLPRDSNGTLINYDNNFSVSFRYDESDSKYSEYASTDGYRFGTIDLCEGDEKPDLNVTGTIEFRAIQQDPGTTIPITGNFCNDPIHTQISGSTKAEDFWIISCIEGEMEAPSVLLGLSEDINITFSIKETNGTLPDLITSGRVEDNISLGSGQSSIQINGADWFTGAYKHLYFETKLASEETYITNDTHAIKVNTANKCSEPAPDNHDCFALRPDKFTMTLSSVDFKAGEDFNITLNALDGQGNPTQGYDENISDQGSAHIQHLEVNNTRCVTGDMNASGLFSNGELTIEDVNYSEAGIIDINISEIMGQEFAVIDENDTGITWAIRSIDSNRTRTDIIYPFELNITDVDYNGSRWLYMDTSLSHNVTITIPSIQAQNRGHSITTNFSEECYAEDINLSFDLSVLSPSGMTDINLSKTEHNNTITSPIERNIPLSSNIEINLTIKDHNFTSGIGTQAEISYNINRQASQKLEPIDINFTHVETTNSFGIQNDSVDRDEDHTTFFYGRINPLDAFDRDADGTAVVQTYYEIFSRTTQGRNWFCDILNESSGCTNAGGGVKMSSNDIFWWPNTVHPSDTSMRLQDGHLSGEPAGEAVLDANNAAYGGGEQNITVTKNSAAFYGVIRATIDYNQNPDLSYLYYSRVSPDNNRSFFKIYFGSKVEGTRNEVTNNPSVDISGGSRTGW